MNKVNLLAMSLIFDNIDNDINFEQIPNNIEINEELKELLIDISNLRL